jgi:hypothetical protein
MTPKRTGSTCERARRVIFAVQPGLMAMSGNHIETTMPYEHY